MIPLRMLTERPLRLGATVAGLGVAFFLSAAQIGLLVGWSNTNAALVMNAGVDVWVMAKRTPAYEFGTAIPRNRLYQVRSVEGVAWAEGLFTAWNVWQCPDGRRVNIEIVGLDDGCVGGPWSMRDGEVTAIRRPDVVVVDETYLSALGVSRLGEEVELMGQRATVGGISRGVRAFTASPHVFTTIARAIRYDKRYRDDEITYVLARAAPGYPPEQVRDAVAAAVPHVEALTSSEFALRTVRYWMLETGAGITVVITAALGMLVGGFIISQTLFSVTQDHLADYATLHALGFSRRRLCGIVFVQTLALWAGGVVPGSCLFFVASHASAGSQIPLEMNGPVFASIVALTFTAGLLASLASVRTVFQVDPVSIFHQ
jgi:putative ABC transport system permease protein